MKIVSSIRECYDDQKSIAEKLKKRCRDTIENSKKEQWHYQDRIKGIESFALKLETGRFAPKQLEDFFGCTIVVENLEAIDKAVELVKRFCSIQSRRPTNEKFTHKSPDSFQFDDLRLYAKFTHNPALPLDPLYDVIFEVQVKTFLQHAWSIATHDLVYKSKNVSWPVHRVAYQTKAMLESVETAIDGVQKLSKTRNINKNSKDLKKITAMGDFLNSKWDESFLPDDIVRLASTLNDLTVATGLTILEIDKSLSDAKSAGRGIKLVNLSPYQVIIQSLLDNKNFKLKNYLTDNVAKRFKVLIVDEIELPNDYPSLNDSSITRI